MKKSPLRLLWSALAFVLSLSVITQVQATLILHEYSGTITAARFNNGDPYGGEIAVGTQFNGFYEFDGSQMPAIGSACQIRLEQCRRSFLIPPYSFSVTVGSFTFTGQNGDYDIRVNDGQTGVSNDFYTVESNTIFAGELAGMRLVQEDDTLTAIDDPSLLYLDPANLADFTANIFQIVGNDSYFTGNLETLERAVPEPPILYLLVPGLLGLVGMARKKTAPHRAK